MRNLMLATCAIAVVLLFGTLWSSRGTTGGSVRQLLDMSHSRGPLTPGFEACDRQPNNRALANFAANAVKRADKDPLLPQSTNFDAFVKELADSINRHPLPARTIDVIFGQFDSIHPACNGDWMEFGVFAGGSINKTAGYRAEHCSASCPPVFGFDTFTGLPDAWVGDAKTTFAKGAFSLQGRFPPVVKNAFLVKGLFSDSIPMMLQQQKEWVSVGRKELFDPAPLSYIHIDCDLFVGAQDALTLLNHKIVPGTVLLFDELINYNRFKENELKALWMWLQETGATIATIGTAGPLPGMTVTMDPDVPEGHGLEFQSAGFVVISKPGTSTSMWK